MSTLSRIYHDTVRAVLDSAAGVGFPYSTPTPAAGTTSGLFQDTISDEELYAMYQRNPIAKVIVSDVAEDAFDKGFKVVNVKTPIEPHDGVVIIKEGEDGNEDPFKLKGDDEKLNTLFNDYFEKNLRQVLLRAYKLARLRGYSLLLIGYADGLSFSEPPVRGARIKYFQPIDKDWIEEIAYEKNENNEVNLPIKITSYKMKSNTVAAKTIHPDRVIHIENAGLNPMGEGESSLFPCYDDLVVLKHVTWGAGQTMWRSGNQMVTVIAPPRATKNQIDAIDAVMSDVNAKSAFTFPFGTEVQTHVPTGLNPAPYAQIPLNNISAATRIPLSVLIGSQAGSLGASLTDQRDYAGTLSAIQNNTLTPILNKLFKRLQYAKELPFVQFKIVWSPTLTMSEAEKTLVEYREALTKRINLQVEQELAQFNQQRSTLGGTSGPMPSNPSTAPGVKEVPVA